MAPLLLFLLALLPARADTFWDIPPDAAAAIADGLHKGDVLVRVCPGCGDEAVAFVLKRVAVAPSPDDPSQAVLTLRWRGLASGVPAGGELAVPPLGCAPAETLCLADPSADCAPRQARLDVPYTFVLRGRSWVWVGELAGLQTPGPAWQTPLPASRSHRKLERHCKAIARPVANPHGPGRPGAPPPRRR